MGDRGGWFRQLGRAVVVAAAALVAASCASTAMTGFANPQFVGTKYAKVMVHVGSDDLALRSQIEQRATKRLSGVAVGAASACEVFFPGREYAADELARTLRDQGIDAVLVIRSAGAGFTSQYVPPTYHTTSTATGSAVTSGFASGSATRVGNTVYGSAHGTSVTTASARSTSTTTVSGGYNINMPWARFVVELIDVGTGQIAWTGQGDSKGNGYNDQEDLWQSVADEAVHELAKSGYLAGARP